LVITKREILKNKTKQNKNWLSQPSSLTRISLKTHESQFEKHLPETGVVHSEQVYGCFMQ
jgi:hypothetical protein